MIDRATWGLALAGFACQAAVGNEPRPDQDAAGEDTADADADPDLGAAACGPGGGGPIWVEEGATVIATIACKIGQARDGRDFTLSSLPDRATYDEATAVLTWKTGLDQAGVYLVTITERRSGEMGELKIGVADKFDDKANVPIKDPTTYTEELGLPVFHLQTSLDDLEKNRMLDAAANGERGAHPCASTCPPDTYIPFSIVYRGHTYAAEGRKRGAASLAYFPKNHLGLRFADGDRFDEPVLAGGRMQKRRHLKLITTFDDKSYVRYRLAFETWNRLDPASLQIDNFSAVVYLNGKYQGLYTVSDKLDDGAALQRFGLSKDANAYMGITHDATFDKFAYVIGNKVPIPKYDPAPADPTKVCPIMGFMKRAGLPGECNGTTFDAANFAAAFADLLPFLDLVANADDARFHAGIGSVINVDDYIRWFVQATAILAGDSYEKNAYHFHDPAGGPWRMVLWDYNISFGQGVVDAGVGRTAPNLDKAGAPITPFGNPPYSPDYAWYEDPWVNNLWTRLWRDPTYGPIMKTRYASVLDNELKLESVLAAFEGLVAETAAGARRDERLWGSVYKKYYGPGSYFNRQDLTTYAQEIPYMRQWIKDRWRHLHELYR